VGDGQCNKTQNTKRVFSKSENDMSDNETRERIEDKALDHFLQFGFSKVTMNEIAEELGMSKKTLYHYFPGKEDLLAEVVRRMHEETATRIEALVDDESLDFVQKLHGALDILSAFHAKMSPYFLADMEKHAPEVCKVSNDFKRDRIRIIMGRLVAEGIQKRVFRDDIDQELIVLIYAGALQSLLRPDTFNRLGLSVSQIHKTIGSVVFEGIVRPESRNELFGDTRLVRIEQPDKIPI
jgi:AcrR family transcriptional regulator